MYVGRYRKPPGPQQCVCIFWFTPHPSVLISDMFEDVSLIIHLFAYHELLSYSFFSQNPLAKHIYMWLILTEVWTLNLLKLVSRMIVTKLFGWRKAPFIIMTWHVYTFTFLTVILIISLFPLFKMWVFAWRNNQIENCGWILKHVFTVEEYMYILARKLSLGARRNRSTKWQCCYH